jgi:hypothetical protein
VPVRSHRLVGRDEELESLVRLLDAPDELPATAVVVGEAGIGKTALWLAAAHEAAALGYLVLSCRPSEAEARFSFSGLADLLGGLVAEVLPELAGSAGLWRRRSPSPPMVPWRNASLPSPS